MDSELEFRLIQVDDYILIVDHIEQEVIPGRIVRIGHGDLVLVETTPDYHVWVHKDEIELDLDKMRPILYDNFIKTRRMLL